MKKLGHLTPAHYPIQGRLLIEIIDTGYNEDYIRAADQSIPNKWYYVLTPAVYMPLPMWLILRSHRKVDVSVISTMESCWLHSISTSSSSQNFDTVSNMMCLMGMLLASIICTHTIVASMFTADIKGHNACYFCISPTTIVAIWDI